MGIVYLARQNRLQRLVAIKRIRPEMLASAKMRRRFLREAQSLARVSHPGICPIYDFGELEGQPFLVMQYLPGKRMSDLQPPANRRELDVLLQRFEQVATAVQVAHEAQLVHRDLKPQNIVLAADGHPVVLDFGLARMLDDESADPLLTTQTQPVGTPAYMAPERLAGQANAAGPSVDIYALGVSLYQGITGVLPFRSPVLEALWSQVLRGDADLRPLRRHWMPKELAVVVRTAMEREPARRYASATSLAEDLRRLRLDLPILAQQPTFLTRVMRWSRRNQAVATLLVVLAIALAATSTLMLHLVAERRHNRSLALAGEAVRIGRHNPAMQAALALAALDQEDQPGARSELAQSLADWQVQTRLVERATSCSMATALPAGGMAAVLDDHAVVASRPIAGRTRFERPDGGVITSCSIAPDEQQVAIGGGDGSLWLFHASAAAPTRLQVGADPILLLQHAPDGRSLAIASDRAEPDRRRTATLHWLGLQPTVLLPLEQSTGPMLRVLGMHFTADGKRLFAVLQGQRVAGYHLPDGLALPSITNAEDPIRCIALVRGDASLVCGTRSGALIEVDLATSTRTVLGEHGEGIDALVQSADGKWLASLGSGRTVRRWQLESPAGQFAPADILRHPAMVTNAAFDPAGRWFVTSANDMVVRLWSARGDVMLELANGLGAASLLAPDGESIWIGSEQNGCGRYLLSAHDRPLLLNQSPVTSLGLSRDGGTMWTGCADGSLHRWHEGRPTPLWKGAGGAITSIQVSADGKTLLAIEENGRALVHDARTDAPQQLQAGAGSLLAGWLLADGREAVLQTAGPARQGNALTRFRRPGTSARFELAGEPQLLPRDLGRGTLDRDGRHLLLPQPRRDGPGGFIILDTASEARPREVAGAPCARVVVAPTPGLHATFLTSHLELRRGLDDPSPLALPTDSSGTNDVAFSPDGRYLAVMSNSGAVWLFRTGDGGLQWRAQVPAIGWCLAFSPDGRHLLTGDSDGVVRHWIVETSTQRELAEQRLLRWQWDEADLGILRENGIAATR
ncbi:MAG: protein kinase [Planctomycetes bacterium]|nr:protein kinase [Planctomycetota bacterium]